MMTILVPLLLPVILCALVPLRIGFLLFSAGLAFFSVGMAHDVSARDTHALVFMLPLLGVCLSVLVLRKAIVIAMQPGHRPLPPRSPRAIGLSAFFLAIAVLYPAMPLAEATGPTIVILAFMALLLLGARFAVHAQASPVRRDVAAALRGAALCPVFLLAFAAGTAWMVARQAEDIAAGRPYCIGIPGRDGNYVAAESGIDLMGIGLRPFPPDPFTYHAAVRIEATEFAGNGTRGDGIWSNWSYRHLAFDSGHDAKNATIPVPRFRCGDGAVAGGQ